MQEDLIDRLTRIGFSEYEAKAYVALLRKNPVTGYELSKVSGIPRSMIYEVLGKLTARGAAMTLHQADEAVKYAPVEAEEFLDQLHREHEELVDTLKGDLQGLASKSDLYDYVWNITGHRNIVAKAQEMILQARDQIYLALLPDTFPSLQGALEEAVRRDVRVALYAPCELELPGAQVIASPTPAKALGSPGGLGLILVIDGEEVLIAEGLSSPEARASWTSSPLLVFIAEHHLRTDLYLPRILALLGDRALKVIREEDRDLFARALESRIHDQ